MSNFHINVTEISEEDRKRALSATEEFLKKIDVQQIDQMRRRFELPPESIGFLVDLYVSKLNQPFDHRSAFPVSSAGATRANREVLSISTPGPESMLDKKLPKGNVLPEQIVSIKMPVKSPFHPSRFMLSNAGTQGGAADWIICDIKFDGKSQFLQSGDIPGDLFATNAVDTFVRWQMCREQAEVIVKYIGTNEMGCPFFGALVGEGNIDAKKAEDAP
jgi:hypothetical protein